eukprot:351436-Chlamydomonas_euryale.AAC.2
MHTSTLPHFHAHAPARTSSPRTDVTAALSGSWRASALPRARTHGSARKYVSSTVRGTCTATCTCAGSDCKEGAGRRRSQGKRAQAARCVRSDCKDGAGRQQFQGKRAQAARCVRSDCKRSASGQQDVCMCLCLHNAFTPLQLPLWLITARHPCFLSKHATPNIMSYWVLCMTQHPTP